MSSEGLIYEDKITVQSWSKSLPFIILGFLLMLIIYVLMPFPVVTVYDTLINIVFSISVGLVLIIVGIYFFVVYRNIRYAVTGNMLIVEYGREKLVTPLDEITSIKKIKELTFKERLKITAENTDKIIIATIRDNDILEVYRKGELVAVITPADIEDFMSACDIKK